MLEKLYPCPCCGGVPKAGRFDEVIEEEDKDVSPLRIRAHPLRLVQRPRTRELVRVVCGSCGLATPWIPIVDGNENAALDECGRLWNTRTDRVPVQTGSLDELIENEINGDDISYVLALIARNDTEWETRGPIFAKLAQRLIDATIVTRDWWPITPTLEDAYRYRKLVSHSHREEPEDGPGSVAFQPIALADDTRTYAYEGRVAAAVDALPDRERW
ncbi:Lar family restriction alleviation protein [Paraburkholderia aromaticivorans]|uniref:Lar family restriction alleviation protein n=1 Tax=Paraburkholderia aromaticivorans TaxID=2026199 RepID=UPI00145600D9|nr:Lar family restriction alleviation protein [Paraburkholderia aromaticivorans]